jgi:membrane-bound metal-dependent hydrolase YbcI (DUF457 family)
VNYVTHAILGLVLGVIGSVLLLGLVKGYVDASKGITEYDPESMKPLQQIVIPIGAFAGVAAGVGIAAWKEKR